MNLCRARSFSAAGRVCTLFVCCVYGTAPYGTLLLLLRELEALCFSTLSCRPTWFTKLVRNMLGTWNLTTTGLACTLECLFIVFFCVAIYWCTTCPHSTHTHWLVFNSSWKHCSRIILDVQAYYNITHDFFSLLMFCLYLAIVCSRAQIMSKK